MFFPLLSRCQRCLQILVKHRRISPADADSSLREYSQLLSETGFMTAAAKFLRKDRLDCFWTSVLHPREGFTELFSVVKVRHALSLASAK